MLIKVSNIIPNPHRDMDKYPIDEKKVTALVESIKQTDFWDNLLARPAGNTVDGLVEKELAAHLKGMNDAGDMVVELAYGHHRLAAVNVVGITEIDIPVKVIGDEIMLQIMANENKGDWGFGNMAVILETVRQVRGTLHAQATDCESYDEYIEQYSFFGTEKDWKAAQKLESIGYRKVHAFLGETWSENDIRSSLATIGNIDTGMFTQEQVIYMPSIGAMNRFHTLVKNIREQDAFPLFFKDRFVGECSDIICDEETGATVKSIQKAATAAKKGHDPIECLTKGKYNAWDIAKALFKLNAENELAVDDIMETEGLGDFDGINEIVDSVLAMIEKAEKKVANAEAGIEETDEADAEAVPQDEVDKEIAEAEAAIDTDLPEGEIPEVTGETSLQNLTETFVHSSSVFVQQINHLCGNVNDLDAAMLEKFGGSFESVFVAMSRLGLEAYGSADLKSLLERAESSM